MQFVSAVSVPIVEQIFHSQLEKKTNIPPPPKTKQNNKPTQTKTPY